MRDRAYFTNRGGKLYKVSEYSLFTEPTLHRLMWHVADERSALEGVPGDYYDGWCWPQVATYAAGYGMKFSLPGNKGADIVETVPILPPPARGKQLRYHEGRWQRLMKRGWVDA